MSDASLVAAASGEGVSAWLADLESAPAEAVEALLLGRVWLGAFSALDAPRSVPQFLPHSHWSHLDAGIQQWLSVQVNRSTLPSGIAPRQLAKALQDGFVLMQVGETRLSQRWCRERAPILWRWLGTQPHFPSRDPRPAFLRALALHQPDQDLLDFWLNICRQGNDRWAPLAIFGLRRMPADDSGTAPMGLPMVVVGGLVDFGVALSRAGDQNKKRWLSEVDFLSAVYPMSAGQWAQRFQRALRGRGDEKVRVVSHWLDERYPQVPEKSRSAGKELLPPYWPQEFQPLLKRFDAESAKVIPELRALMDKHRHYARETGDPSFLVSADRQLASFLQKGSNGKPRDAAWALELALEASEWAPGDPRSWTATGLALEACGDFSRALAVRWYARRRFPYNAHSHTQLGNLLIERKHLSEGEAVFRAAIERFPDNAVCWTELGRALETSGRHPEALDVLRRGQKLFPQDHYICVGIANALTAMGRLAEAESTIERAQQLDSDDPKPLAKARDRLVAAQRGEAAEHRGPHPMRAANPTPALQWSQLESLSGIDLRGLDSLGLATLWRQQGGAQGIEKAEKALQSAAENLIQGHEDSRWLLEYGLFLAARDGSRAELEFLEAATSRRPGDGVLMAQLLQAKARSGDAVDWNAFRQSFEELAPLARASIDPGVPIPAELKSAVAAVRDSNGIERLDELDDELRQALWVYSKASDPVLGDLAQQDFLAAKQLAVF